MGEFTAIVGDRGSGKTNFLAAVLHREHLRGKKIISNFKLNFPHTYMPFSEIVKFPVLLRDAVLGLDELGRGADSYEFFDSRVKEITNIVLQLRKRHCEAWYTVQRFGLITKRLRDQTDGFLLMEDIDGKRRTYVNAAGEVIEVDNHREICGGKFRVYVFNDQTRFIKRRVFNGKPFWHLYDTDEEIGDNESAGDTLITLADYESK